MNVVSWLRGTGQKVFGIGHNSYDGQRVQIRNSNGFAEFADFPGAPDTSSWFSRLGKMNHFGNGGYAGTKQITNDIVTHVNMFSFNIDSISPNDYYFPILTFDYTISTAANAAIFNWELYVMIGANKTVLRSGTMGVSHPLLYFPKTVIGSPITIPTAGDGVTAGVLKFDFWGARIGDTYYCKSADCAIFRLKTLTENV